MKLRHHAIAAAVAALCLPAGALAQTVLKFAHYAETTHPAHTAATQFATNVTARTNGRIKIDVFPANQLGAPPEQLQQVKLGTIDIGVPDAGPARQVRPGVRRGHDAVRLRRPRARAPRARRPGDGLVRADRGEAGLRDPRQLGVGVPQPDQSKRADQRCPTT